MRRRRDPGAGDGEGTDVARRMPRPPPGGAGAAPRPGSTLGDAHAVVAGSGAAGGLLDLPAAPAAPAAGVPRVSVVWECDPPSTRVESAPRLACAGSVAMVGITCTRPSLGRGPGAPLLPDPPLANPAEARLLGMPPTLMEAYSSTLPPLAGRKGSTRRVLRGAAPTVEPGTLDATTLPTGSPACALSTADGAVPGPATVLRTQRMKEKPMPCAVSSNSSSGYNDGPSLLCCPCRLLPPALCAGKPYPAACTGIVPSPTVTTTAVPGTVGTMAAGSSWA